MTVIIYMGMEINVNKTSLWGCGNTRSMHLFMEHQWLLQGILIHPTTLIKMLGIWFDHRLTFHDHCLKTCLKIQKKIYIFKKLGNKITERGKITLFQAFISPCFTTAPQSGCQPFTNLRKPCILPTIACYAQLFDTLEHSILLSCMKD